MRIFYEDIFDNVVRFLLFELNDVQFLTERHLLLGVLAYRQFAP